MKKVKIKFEEMIPFEKPKKTYDRMSIRIDEKGRMHISKSILEYFSGVEGRVDFRHTKDYRVIALKECEESQFKLPKVGIMKYDDLKKDLQDKGYKIPAVYLMKKVDEEKMWVGKLQEVAPAPL